MAEEPSQSKQKGTQRRNLPPSGSQLSSHRTNTLFHASDLSALREQGCHLKVGNQLLSESVSITQLQLAETSSRAEGSWMKPKREWCVQVLHLTHEEKNHN